MFRSWRQRARRWPVVALVTLACLAPAACSPDEPDVEKALQLTDVVTGWFDAGIVEGQNKLVPTITFRAKNGAPARIAYVSFNTVFRVINDPEELGAVLLKGIGGDGLAPGASTEAYVARSNLGYTSPAPRMDMLQHSQFKDAQVEVFAKHRSRGWVKLGEYKVQRQLLTR